MSFEENIIEALDILRRYIQKLRIKIKELEIRINQLEKRDLKD